MTSEESGISKNNEVPALVVFSFKKVGKVIKGNETNLDSSCSSIFTLINMQ